MAIRITQNAMANGFNTDVQSIYSKLAKSQQQVADGRRITKPSDDPFGTGQVLGFDAQLADTKRYQANTSESISMLDAQDAALDSVTSAMQQIYSKAVQGGSDSNNATDRNAIATEILQLKEVVRQAMNSKHGDTYLFGGTASSTPPFPGPGNAYAGSANTISRRVGDNQSVQVNVAGDTVLGPTPTSTLDVIDQLVTDLQANNGTNVRASLGSIQAQTNMALNVRTQLGATSARLQVTSTRLDLTEERLISARTDVADVDSAEAFMKFSQQQTMYQAALASGTQMLKTSILDFL
ncbi:MAG: flagellar hook-associated protein 3 [Thermoleophilia bacterium]|nr:flagellar hook-associated protein 3 [Thermoleophilia bacterium]